ncbi:SHOCT domain-containing protein [Palaeococcus ferrophilus]|uniref:SHOCT domain-containing protein n=1 Tax=Palaeococcus ferrophilus TaxID=83868 RepID=UPI0006974405|nr:SHOCT domain-containing protein [Palaeococcus ferrophilus]
MMFESTGSSGFLVHAGEGTWGWHDMMGFGWFGWFGMLFMLIFWVLIIVGIVWLVKWLLNQGSGGSKVSTSKERALELLDEAYARGEIDDEEYERRRRKILEE